MTKVSCAAGPGSANNDAADVVFFTGGLASDGGEGGLVEVDQARGLPW